MKRALFFTLFALILQSCVFQFETEGDEPLIDSQEYEAITLNRTEFENAVQIKPVQNMRQSGKIYLYQNYVFINDVNKGFHCFRYNPNHQPIAHSYIDIPGATDLAIRNNILYINQAVDLVSLQCNADFTEILNIHRNRNVFPQKPAPNGWGNYYGNDIVIDWKLK